MSKKPSKKPKNLERNLDDFEKKLVPPKHLEKSGRAFWCATVREYTLRETHLIVLLKACECLDQAEAARVQLSREGFSTDTGSGGLKTHPCVGVGKSALFTFVRLIRELGVSENTRSAPQE